VTGLLLTVGKLKRVSLFVASALLATACVRRVSVNELLPVSSPVPTASLVERIDSFGRIRTLAAQGSVYVRNYFTGVGSKADELPGGNQLIRLQRPALIRMRVTVPVAGTRVVDMMSNGHEFRLALYHPKEKSQFLHGRNLGSYEHKGAEELAHSTDSSLAQAGGLINMRPQHITEAFLIQPIVLNHKTEYFREEARLIEPDDRPGKKGRLVERGYYVLSVLEQREDGLIELRRKYWFDRSKPGTPLTRQQTFDGSDGKLASDITYFDWFTPGGDVSLPSRVIVDRRSDGYRIELTLERQSVEVNTDLPDTAFMLENTDGLKDVDLDAPKIKPAAAQHPSKPPR
jgi:hypothetical protein